MLRRLKEAAEQGEPPRLWGTRSGMRRRGCLQCVWEELAAFIPSRRLSKRKAIEFTSLLQNKDHKETNTVRAGGMLAEAPKRCPVGAVGDPGGIRHHPGLHPHSSLKVWYV